MIAATRHQKHYASANARLLHERVARFVEEMIPGILGPDLCARFAQRLLDLLDTQLMPTGHLQSGQCLWNAVAIETRADSPRLRLIPVTLTLIHADDLRRLAAGESRKTILPDVVARLCEEAFHQGALLSMRDLGLLTWQQDCRMSSYRQTWETTHGRLLPHPGTLQDMGTCVTHKVAIVEKAVYQRIDPRQVARETHHTQWAVDRYLRDFHRVRLCYRHTPDLDYICQVTGLTAFLVKQYLQIIQTHETPADGATPSACDILPSV